MIVLGILGSPRTNGISAKLLKQALDGALSRGADVKKIELINCDIRYCKGCGICYQTNPELQVGKCPLKDDMPSLLSQYASADGYIYASPVYDMFVTALMKTFIERKISLTYRPKDAIGKLPESRIPAHFLKKASIILTANSPDEYREVMADPCFDAINGQLMMEMVDTIDQFYVGGVDSMTQDRMQSKLDEAFQIGLRLVDAIQEARA